MEILHLVGCILLLVLIITLIFLTIKSIKTVNKIDTIITDTQEKLDSMNDTFTAIEQVSTLVKNIIDYLIDLKIKLIGK